MKNRHWFVVLIALLSFGNIQAQRIAYVDTDYILNKLPDYRSAQKQLDDLSVQWEKEIEGMRTEIDKLYKSYRAEEVLLTASQKKEREDAIVNKENEMKAYEEAKFGFEGELFKKRQEFVKPIQDKVFTAIQKVAKTNSLDFVLDKAANMNILFSNPKYDKSDEVLDELGIASE